jgi:hypothetical protein
MRILFCAGITCGSTRKTVNLHEELVLDAPRIVAQAIKRQSGAQDQIRVLILA